MSSEKRERSPHGHYPQVEFSDLMDYPVPLSAEQQPDHGPGHIKSLGELPLGTVVQFVDASGAEDVCVLATGKKYADVTKGPALGDYRIVDDPGWMIVARTSAGGEIVPASRSMADAGLVPYESGYWNAINRIRTVPTPPSDDEH